MTYANFSFKRREVVLLVLAFIVLAFGCQDTA